MVNFKEELIELLIDLLGILSEHKQRHNVNYFIGTLKTKNVQKYVFPKRWFIGFLYS